jgi:hypothetical protein
MARRAIENALAGQADMLKDPLIIARMDEIVSEVEVLLQAIRNIHGDKDSDPFTDAETLAESARLGIMDAPHLKNNSFARGEIRTRIINGTCEAIDENNQKIPENVRLAKYLK